MRGGPPLLLDDFLPYRLNVLAAEVSEGLARVYSERFGLDIPGWRVMATLGRFGRATGKTISDHSHMHKTKVSRAVMQLAARGLVTRSPNLADKRESFIALTAEGAAMYAEIAPLALAYQQKLSEALTPGQQEALSAAIAALVAEARRQRMAAAGSP